jgi:hypothetical protein
MAILTDRRTITDTGRGTCGRTYRQTNGRPFARTAPAASSSAYRDSTRPPGTPELHVLCTDDRHNLALLSVNGVLVVARFIPGTARRRPRVVLVRPVGDGTSESVSVVLSRHFRAAFRCTACTLADGRPACDCLHCRSAHTVTDELPAARAAFVNRTA